MKPRAASVRVLLVCALIICSAHTQARAQDTQNDFLPEIVINYKISPNVQVYLQAKDDREAGDQQRATIGPSIQFYRKPLLSLKHLVFFDLDSTKSAPWMFESGYRVLTAPDAPIKNRLFEAMTIRFPLLHQVAVGNRDRVDLDWQNGEFTWQFRNRLVLARMFSIRSFHFAPYAMW